jgi:hypothetical protein
VSGDASEASIDRNNHGVARKQDQEKKYPLWKYVTRKKGLGERVVGGENVIWTSNYCKNEFKGTYYRVKGHLLGLPRGLGACKAVNVTQQKEMERENDIVLGKVAITSWKKMMTLIHSRGTYPENLRVGLNSVNKKEANSKWQSNGQYFSTR